MLEQHRFARISTLEPPGCLGERSTLHGGRPISTRSRPWFPLSEDLRAPPPLFARGCRTLGRPLLAPKQSIRSRERSRAGCVLAARSPGPRVGSRKRSHNRPRSGRRLGGIRCVAPWSERPSRPVRRSRCSNRHGFNATHQFSPGVFPRPHPQCWVTHYAGPARRTIKGAGHLLEPADDGGRVPACYARSLGRGV